MTTRTRWMNGKAMAAAAVATLSMACSGGASALAQVPRGLSPLLHGDGVEAGTEAEGYALGRRNGEILVGRLHDRTVGTEGCEAISRLEDALVRVTRSIRRPDGGEDLTRGFYRGYLDSVRDGIRETRSACNRRRYSSGAFAGELYGALLCQVSKASIDLATSLELEWLYDGWTGGSVEVIQECRTQAAVVLRDCDGDVADLLTLSVERSCSDSNL